MYALQLITHLALDMPFLLLPFRPASDPSAARTFIRNFFSMEKGADLKGARLEQELVLTEPMVSRLLTATHNKTPLRHFRS